MFYTFGYVSYENCNGYVLMYSGVESTTDVCGVQLLLCLFVLHIVCNCMRKNLAMFR